MMVSEQEIIELLRKHDGNAYDVDRELKTYLGYTHYRWIKVNDRVRGEYDRLKHERRLNRL